MRSQGGPVIPGGRLHGPIGVSAAGFAWVVASCGTALTAQHVQALKRHTSRIFVNFDPDAPEPTRPSAPSIRCWRKACRPAWWTGRRVGSDEYCRERGAAAYQARIDGAKGTFTGWRTVARNKYDVHTQEGIVACCRLAAGASADRRSAGADAMAGDVAGYIGVARGLVLDSFRKTVAAREDKPLERPKGGAASRRTHGAPHAVPGPRERGDDCGAEVLESWAACLSGLFRHFRFRGGRGGRRFEESTARLEDADRQLLAEAVLREDSPLRRRGHGGRGSLRAPRDGGPGKQVKAHSMDWNAGGKWEEAPA